MNHVTRLCFFVTWLTSIRAIVSLITCSVISSIVAYFLIAEFIFHGDITQELPEGYECIGEVKNIGDAFTGNDFEGNADGKIYINKSVADTAYFSWAEWNEEADGCAPFLKLELEPKM